MDIDHPARHSLDPPAELVSPQTTGFRAESLFDGTKLPLVVGHSQNHKYGMNLLNSGALR
jgi:hypothetical protein